jgi:hypothetical protein
MKMDVDVDYHDLDGYQKALLSLVELDEYSEAVVDRLHSILQEVTDERVNAAIRKLSAFYEMEDAWPFLFSYDYLKTTYLGLREWHKTGVCPELIH